MPGMPIKIRYVSLPDGKKNADANQKIREVRRAEAVRELVHALESRAGGMNLLRLRSMREGGFAYYSAAVEGILADFTNKETLENWSRSLTRVLFPSLDENRSMRLCGLEGGLLNEEEYTRLLEGASGAERSVLEALPVVTLDPSDGEMVCRDHGEGAGAFGIPVFRCAWDSYWKKPASAYELAAYLVGKGFLPELGAVGGKSPSELWNALQGVEPPVPVLKASPDGDAEEQARWREILKYYRETGLRTASLPPYPDSVLRVHGSWDLYRFTGETLPNPGERRWYEVSGLYARDPKEDVAPDAEYVAIDFGTTNTIAAVFQNNMAITTMPVGGGRGQTENPTILMFKNLQDFLAAYTVPGCFRPETEFEQVPTSHNALASFESHNRKDVRNYLNQLKQWVYDPNRTIHLIDRKSERNITLGREMKMKPLTVDPIELYAYYIGLSLNDMHKGKIYLKYLLSFSATYSIYSREWIRESFEKGLRKALPPAVGKDEKFKLNVRLWQDEATSYAICAVDRFLMTGGRNLDAFQQGIFYGIYDFGGGTLDFSFGTVQLKLEPALEQEIKVFTQLLCGGSPVMGCENLLDELAYVLFEDSYKAFNNQMIKCSIPMGCDPRQYQDCPVVSGSAAAQFNTCSMVAYLRKKWVGSRESGGAADKKGLDLLGEDGNPYEWIPGREGGNLIQMDISDEKIEAFFVKKVNEGIELFLNCLQKAVKRLGKPQICHVFLAGSASQAERVWTLFEAKKSGGEHGTAFELHRPMPTDADREARKSDRSLDIPTAKSGVAYGLLMSRPGAEDIVVKRKMPEVWFHYHLGIRTKSPSNNIRGMFHLLLEKSMVPKYEAGIFQRIRPVLNSDFELLYTFDDSYSMTEQNREINGTVRILTLHVPEKCVGKGLYIRAKSGSDVEGEIGVSLQKDNPADAVSLPASSVIIVGTCNFAKGTFEEKYEAPLAPREPAPQPQPDPNPRPEPRPQPDAGEDWPRPTAGNYRLGYLPPNGGEPKWELDTAGCKENRQLVRSFEGDRFVLCWKQAGTSQRKEAVIPLKGYGGKRIFVRKVDPPVLRLWYQNETGSHEFTVNLQTREVREDGK